MAEVVKDTELHRIVMTCIIYNDEGKFLATKRAPTKKVFPNKWTIPGGGLEPDDYINEPKTTDDAWYDVVERALAREVKEEVSLEIGKPKFLLDLIFIRPDGVPVITLSYYAPYKSGDVVLEEGDATEFRWVSAQEAQKMDFIEGIPEEILMVDQILKGNPEPIFSIDRKNG